jgi:hypothetical protein
VRYKTATLWRWVLGNVLVLAGLALTGFAVVSLVLMPRLQEILVQAVRRELVLPGSADVEVQLGTIPQTLAGFLPGFRVSSPSAVIDDIPFQGLRFDAAGVDFNMRRILRGDKAAITAVGSAGLTLRMSSDELTARLVPLLEDEGIAGAGVEFGADSVTVTGVKDADMSAVGRFCVTDDNRVGFMLTDFQFDALQITVTDLTLLLDDLLPALDLGGMYAGIVIDDISTTSEYVEIRAHTETMAAGRIDREVEEVF